MPTRPRLITERDVRQAAKRGERALDARGARVTPSARDLAAQLRIALEGATPARAAAPPPAATATPLPPATRARVVLGADHGGVAMKDALVTALRGQGHPVEDVGTYGPDAVDYPDFAAAVARAVAEGRADVGIMVDGAGIGSCMVANKVAGVRAAMCHDLTTAVNAREHNNANVLTLGGTLLGQRLALEVVQAFLATPFGGGRHAPRVAKIDALDGPGR